MTLAVAVEQNRPRMITVILWLPMAAVQKGFSPSCHYRKLDVL